MSANLMDILVWAGAAFVVVDQDEEKLNNAEANDMLIVEGNAIEEDVLLRAGVHFCACSSCSGARLHLQAAAVVLASAGVAARRPAV